MKFVLKNKFFIVSLILTYAFLVGVYYLTSVGIRHTTLFLQMRRYIPCALAVTIAIYMWKQAGLTLKQLFPHAAVGLLWVLVYPICYWLTYHSTLTFIDKHFDEAFGAYFFAFMVCLRLLLLKWKDSAICNFFFALLDFAAVLIPCVQLAYFANYQYPITEAASIAVLQTNPEEAKEYLLLNLGYTGIVVIAFVLIILLLSFIHLNKLKVNFSFNFNKKYIITALVVCLATSIYSSKMFFDTGVMQTYVFAKEYFEGANKFKAYHEKNFADLVVTPSKPVFAKPSTIIMVIGESASSYYMSAYSDVKNDNTPWLRSMKANDNFVLFTHAYTSRVQTVPSLERALTEKNQYNKKEFYQSLTILDIAKKAGYETYWFSNQGYISDADTPITMVAKTADHAEWLSEDKSLNGKYQYDGDLLNCLKNVDPTKNNFVVLHFMGSHEDCINRYPQSFAKFSKPGEYDMVLNYDDSLAYSDYVLSEVYKYANKNLNLQAMLYFSDHGGDPYRKRHPDNVGFKSSQIPMFVYVSDEYKDLFKNSVATFKENRNAYFTNDLMYEVVCSLLQIKSNHFNEDESLLNSSYKYTRETLRTELGSRKLTDDKAPRRDW